MLRKNIAFLLKGTNEKQALEAAHLAAHSLKSQSLLMGYEKVGKLAGEMEKIFIEKKENSLNLDRPSLLVINESLKKVQTTLSKIAENGEEVDMTEETEKLKEILNSK